MPPDTQPNPKILNLVKSIGLAETGGDYNARGKNGEIGAYQMTPDFIQGNAPKYGVDPNNLDQASQNKLAYSVVQDWAKQGLSPAQIASKWNSGNPDAYQDPEYKGTNATGTSYDVPAYVNKVQDNYDKFSGQSAMPQQALQPNSPGFLSRFVTNLSGDIPKLEAAGTLGLAATGVGLGAPILGAIGAGATGVSGLIKGGLGLLGAETAVKGIGNAFTGGEKPQTPQTPETPTQQPQKTDFLSGLFAQSPQESNASKTIAQSLIQNISGTLGGRKALGDPSFQGAVQSASLYGHVPTLDSQGNMDFTSAEQKAEATLAQLAQGEEKILASEKQRASMEEAIKHASQSVQENKLLTPIEKQEVIKNIIEEARSYSPRSKGVESGGIPSFGLDELAQARRQQYAASRGKYGVGKTTAKITSHKALAFGLRETIKNHVENKDLYNALLKEESNLINERRIFKLLHGKKAIATTKFSKELHEKGTRYLATYIGDRIGGPLGIVVGNILLSAGQKIADKKYGKNVFESPQFQAALKIVQEKEPKAYKFFVDEIKKAGVTPPELKKESTLIKVLNAEQKKYKKTKKVERKEKTSKILEKGLIKPIKKL